MATTQNLRGTSYSSFRIGKRGPQVYQGSSAATGATGNDGDLYIRSGGTPRLYQKIDGNWAQLESTQKVVQSKSSNYQTALPDQVVLMDSSAGNLTLTIGNTSLLSGKQLIVKDSGGNATNNPITITTQGGQTIDGQASIQIVNDFESVTFICDGNNWFII